MIRFALMLGLLLAFTANAQLFPFPYNPAAAGTPPPSGGITFEGGDAVDGTASPITLNLTGVSSGNILILMCGYAAGTLNQVSGVSDDCGDLTWTELQDGGGNTGRQTTVYYNNEASSGNCQIDVAFSDISNAFCSVGEFTNVTTADIRTGTQRAGFGCNAATDLLDPPGTGADAVLHVGILSHANAVRTLTPGSEWDGEVGNIASGSRTGSMTWVLTDGSEYDAGGTAGTTGWTCSGNSSFGMIQASFGPAS